MLSKTFRGKNWKVKRFCYSCGCSKDDVNIRKAGDGHYYYDWKPNHDEEGSVLCPKCYFHLIYYPKNVKRYTRQNKLTHAKFGPRRLNYKGNLIYLPECPRTGTCFDCGRSVSEGEIKRTNLHHLEYDDNNPLDNTVELCVGCHRKRHMDSAA